MFKVNDRPQDTAAAAPGGVNPDPRALDLLGELQHRQGGLPRAAALAWERAMFAVALDHPTPRRRIQAFLGQGK